MEQWEIDQLNYKVKLIEATLGITYEGNSNIGKQLFVDGYWDECRKVVDGELDSAYEEMKQIEEEKAIVEQYGEDVFKLENRQLVDIPKGMSVSEYREWRNKMKKGKLV